MVLRRERIDTGIDADVTNKEFRALNEVTYLIKSRPQKLHALAAMVAVRCCPSKIFVLGNQSASGRV
jgi:hypothetical protein